MLFTVIGIAVVSAMLIIFIKQYRPEYSMLTAAIVGAVLTAAVIIEFSGLKDTLISLFELSGIDSELLVTVIKAMGVCYITGFASDICRDFGQTSLAGKIELAGKITVVLINVPTIKIIINTAVELIG